MSEKTVLMLQKVSLTIMERLAIGRMMPKAGDVITMLMIRHINKAVEPTVQEVEFLKKKTLPNGNLILADAENIETVCEFTPEQIVFIREQLERLDKEEGVTLNILDLYEKFAVSSKEDERTEQVIELPKAEGTPVAE